MHDDNDACDIFCFFVCLFQCHHHHHHIVNRINWCGCCCFSFQFNSKIEPIWFLFKNSLLTTTRWRYISIDYEIFFLFSFQMDYDWLIFLKINLNKIAIQFWWKENMMTDAPITHIVCVMWCDLIWWFKTSFSLII